jgi:hypothetical protein
MRRNGGKHLYSDLYPSFEEKHVLKPKQLDLVRDFPRETESLRYADYADYADGILFGCRVSAGGVISVSPGIVLHEGIFYRMTETARISYTHGEGMQYLKVRFSVVAPKEDILERRADIVLEDAPAAENETELARFRLKEGARLRSDYTGFDDLDTEFDTLCVLHSPCASRGGKTLLPFVTALFAEEALSCKPENPADTGFAMLCLQAERVNRAVLQSYLGRESAEPAEIYEALKEKLAGLRAGRRKERNEVRTFKRISVD